VATGLKKHACCLAPPVSEASCKQRCATTVF
jgi:hypothetical protein